MSTKPPEKPSGRGGPRPGSGRKKVLPDGSERTAVVLTPEILAWLDAQGGNRSETIRRVLLRAAKRR